MKKIIFIALLFIACGKKQELVIDTTETVETPAVKTEKANINEIVTKYYNYDITWHLYKNFNHPYGYVINDNIKNREKEYKININSAKEYINIVSCNIGELIVNGEALKDNRINWNIINMAQSAIIVSYLHRRFNVTDYDSEVQTAQKNMIGRLYGISLDKDIDLNFE